MASTNKTHDKVNNKKSASNKNRKRTKSASIDNISEPKPKVDIEEERYAVFKSDTIECFAEQFMYADDVKLSSEFYSRLADDATYKLYELVHNIKTFAHTSGGLVSVDIINETLKSSDVPPVLGCAKPLYEDIGYDKDDESHFFSKDILITINEEIQNSIKLKQNISLGMKVDYFIMPHDMAFIQTFYTKISRGLLAGSLKELKDCLQILMSVEQLEPILPNILIMCSLVLKNYLRVLSNDSSYNKRNIKNNETMYQRVLLILLALSNNYLIRTSTVSKELFQIIDQLCQILCYYAHINLVTNKENKRQYNTQQHKMDFFESCSETDINIIDENNSSIIMNLDDIIECKSIFKDNDEKKNILTSNIFKFNMQGVEKICEVLVAIGKNWLSTRRKIIELLISKLFDNINDMSNMQCIKIIAMAVCKLLYNFDNKTFIELKYWLTEVYGESALFDIPIKETYLNLII